MTELPRTWKLATVWLLLGLLVFLAVQALQREQRRSKFSARGGTIELRRAGDGHYHWPGRLNGMRVDFMVDTGATTTALPEGLARDAGLVPEGTVRSSTAGGDASGRLARADLALEGGVEVARLPVVVLPALEAPLLGMDVLSRLAWSQQAGVLRIATTSR